MKQPNDWQSGEPAIDWRSIDQLLQADNYEQVAQYLHQTQKALEGNGNVATADTLATLRQIYLLCHECKSTSAWHRQASQESELREQKLRQQAQKLLERIGPSDPHPDRPSIFAPDPQTIEKTSLQYEDSILDGGASQRGRSPTVSAEGTKHPLEQDQRAVVAPRAAHQSLVFHCFGPFRVYQNNQTVDGWSGWKGQSILKYLVAHKGQPVPKDVLMETFWPDSDPESTRRNLHQAIYSLRQALRRGAPGFQHILFENNSYFFHPELSFWVDFEEFEDHVHQGNVLESQGRIPEAMKEYGTAEGLYQGDFLEDDLYEEWSRSLQENLRSTYITVADRLGEYYIGQQEFAATIALCQKLLQRDNCHEGAHQRLMRCYLAQGQRHMAIRQFQACVQTLKDELDVPPSDELVSFYRTIVPES